MVRTTIAAALLLGTGFTLAQPQGRIIWSFEGNDGIYDAIAIPDVDGDSLPDVAAAIYYSATPSDPRKLYCCSGATGDTIWVNRTAYGTWGNKGLDVAPDLNHDGRADVLLGTAGGYTTAGRSVVAVNGLTGDTLWRYTRYQYWGWVYSVRSFADIDGDSVMDVLGGSGNATDSAGAAVLVSGRTGQAIWLRRMYDDGVGSVAPFADVNGDSLPDVLVGVGGNSNSDSVLCLSGATGAAIWRYPAAASVSDVERIRDVNNSGTDDCIGGGWDYNVYCLEGSNGDLIWQTSMGSPRIIMELVPIRDVNADGRDDVIVGLWDSQVHVLSGLDGTTIWSGPVGADVWSVDTLADVTGDNVPEVVAGCLGDGTGTVKVFNGVTGVPLWYHTFSERVYDVTGAPDLTGDGHPKVLVGLQDHELEPDHLFCFDGSPPSGTAEPSIAGSEPSPTVGMVYLPRHREIAFAAPADVRYQVGLYDASGRAAGPEVSGTTAGPETRIGLAGLNLTSGPYFVRLTLDRVLVQTAKIIIP